MSSSFTVRSAAGVLVSLLNPVDISPADYLQRSPCSSPDELLTVPALKAHICSECSRSFSTSGHLNRHRTVHTGEKVHICPYPGCGKRATRHDNLVQHYRMHLPRGEHKRATTYIHSKMDSKMEELDISPIRVPRGRKPKPVHTLVVSVDRDPRLTYEPDNVSPLREAMSRESSMSASFPPSDANLTIAADQMSDSTVSPSSSPLLTPPGRLSAATVPEPNHTFRAYEPEYQSLSCAIDTSRRFRLSNAREG